MTISRQLFQAILSIDSYNRGYNPGLQLTIGSYHYWFRLVKRRLLSQCGWARQGSSKPRIPRLDQA